MPPPAKTKPVPPTGSVAPPIHVLQQVMHGQNIRTTKRTRNPEQVRNVNHVALQAPYDRPECEIPLQRVIAAGQRNRVEVRRQWATFRYLRRRSDEEILALAVQARQRADPRSGCTCQPRIPSCDGCRW